MRQVDELLGKFHLLSPLRRIGGVEFASRAVTHQPHLTVREPFLYAQALCLGNRRFHSMFVSRAKFYCLKSGCLKGFDDRLEVHILQHIVGDSAELHGDILSRLPAAAIPTNLLRDYTGSGQPWGVMPLEEALLARTVNLGLLWGVAGAVSLLADQPVSFSRDIQPLLEAKCWTCHGGAVQLSRLDLRTREAALKGGQRGTAIVPGKSGESRLYRLIAGLEKPAMPLGGSLTAGE